MLTVLALIASLASADTLTATQVRESYPEFMKITFDSVGGWRMSARADTLPVGHPLAGFVRERKQYLSYLAGRVFEHIKGVHLESAPVRDSVRRAFYLSLRTDSVYERSILGPLAGYLKAHGGVLEGFAAPPSSMVPMRRAVAVAARFYNPDVILPDGRIGVHICTLFNGVFQSSGERDIALEAVAFAAVWDDVSRPDSLSYAGKDFDTAFSRVRALPLAGTKAERIKRAQQLMWSTFEDGTGLPALLTDQMRRWPGMPFVLRPD